MDTANVVLFRSRFAAGSIFPDRRIYPLVADDGTPLGNLGVHDDGTLFVSSDAGPAQSWYVTGDVAYVDKGRSVPGRGLRIVDGPTK